MTPSGLSQQLAKLEREAGQPLLVRDGRGVRLTPAGRLLVAHAAEILDRLTLARSELDRLHDEVTGTVRVGALPTVVDGLFPRLVQLLVERHPRLRITLLAGESEDTIPRVVHGDIDIAVFDSWDQLPTRLPSSITNRTLFEDVADLALPAGHRLAHRSSIELSELNDVEWVTWVEGSTCAEWMVQTLRLSGLDPTVRAAVSSFATQMSLVSLGIGAALVPRLGRSGVPAGVVLIPVRPALKRTISALWRPPADRASVHAVIDALDTVGAGAAAELERS